MNDILGLLKQASGPGDIATILIAGTAGYVVDAGLNAVGFLEPGIVGVTAASAALGIKKTIDANRARAREEKARDATVAQQYALVESRGVRLASILATPEYRYFYDEAEHELTLIRNRMRTPDQHNERLDKILSDFERQRELQLRRT